MSVVQYFELKTQYNSWMNEKLYKACRHISDEQRKKNLGAFFGSIHGTLNHLLLADLIWLSRLGVSVEIKATSLSDIIHDDFDDLSVERKRTDELITNYIYKLIDSDLHTKIRYTSLQSGKTNELPLGLILTHLFNHQTHHRGQLTTLMSQIGLDFGVTDMIFMPLAADYLELELEEL